MSFFIENISDVAKYKQRVDRVMTSNNNLSEHGNFSRFDHFGNFPGRVQDLLQFVGVFPDPLRPIRWDLIFGVDSPFFGTVFEFDLPPNNRDTAQLSVKLRTRGWRYEHESRLLAFGSKPRPFGDPAMAQGNLIQLLELAKPQYEFFHLPLLEDLFRFAEAKVTAQTEAQSMVTPA